MKKILLVLLSCHSSLCLGAEPTGGVKVTLSMAAPGALELRYDLPPGCTRLDFMNAGIKPNPAAVIRKQWTPLDQCAEAGPEGISIKDSTCTSARFSVPTSDRRVDRVYPWAQPIDRGIYSHTSAFAVMPSCGPVSWVFDAGAGRIVVDGAPLGARSEHGPATPDIHYAPVIFLQDKFAAGADPFLHRDTRIEKWATDALQRDLRQIEANYRKQMHGLEGATPFLLTVAVPKGQGGWGDVANRKTMRLNYPISPSPAQQTKLKLYVAHEAAHVFQASEANERWKDEITLINEGGAELLAWLTSAQLGWKDRAALTTQIEDALNKCLIEVGDNRYASVERRGWGKTPYDCGLAMHVLGLAGRAHPTNLNHVLRDYYLDAKQGRPTDFAKAIECGKERGCAAQWLPRMLSGPETLPQVIHAYAAKTGLVQPATELSPNMLKVVGRRTFGALMEHDCKGQISIYQEDEASRIGQVDRCATLRENMAVVAVEGFSLLTRPEAVPALLKACRENGHTVLGLEDGSKVTIPCNDSIPAPRRLYAVNADRLFKRLGLTLPVQRK